MHWVHMCQELYRENKIIAASGALREVVASQVVSGNKSVFYVGPCPFTAG